MCLCWWAALVSLTTALLHSVLLGTPVPQPVCSSYLSVAWWLLAEEPSCLRRRDQTSGAKDGGKRPVVYWIPVFPGRKESKLPPENEDREVEELESPRSIHVSQAALPEMGVGGGGGASSGPFHNRPNEDFPTPTKQNFLPARSPAQRK